MAHEKQFDNFQQQPPPIRVNQPAMGYPNPTAPPQYPTPPPYAQAPQQQQQQQQQ
eukprot:CAMPEP_0197595088 /NCGR_PEP_ID=MMETSP1326-20131121/22024_1 /TAXON_ID=1155430 /ORGANISM="Genus nov. species nov., Strain RCC2288" /LENGTH=54 /DNA_ID=CAMNT_0043161383 /DNA_START=171 /DNA_END=332 /DNA_ORIENTATION=-